MFIPNVHRALYRRIAGLTPSGPILASLSPIRNSKKPGVLGHTVLPLGSPLRPRTGRRPRYMSCPQEPLRLYCSSKILKANRPGSFNEENSTQMVQSSIFGIYMRDLALILPAKGLLKPLGQSSSFNFAFTQNGSSLPILTLPLHVIITRRGKYLLPALIRRVTKSSAF